MITDVQLQQLCVKRRQLMQDLAHVLTRVGYLHPTRQRVNAARAVRRKALRRALRKNAEEIASRCMTLIQLIP